MGVNWNRNPDRKIQSLADLALANESQARLINLRLLFDGVITPDEYAARMIEFRSPFEPITIPPGIGAVVTLC